MTLTISPNQPVTRASTIPSTIRPMPTKVIGANTFPRPVAPNPPGSREGQRGRLVLVSAAYVVDAVRSPIGRRNGSLAGIRADDLAAQVLNGLVARHDLDAAEIEDVQMGCVSQVNEQAWNIGRNAALAAGWPVSVCGATTDRQCGSSMQTNFSAATAVMAGQLDLVVSAGVEMMSRVPMGSNNGSMSQAIHDRFEIVMQGISAEYIAERWNLSREELDGYSYESHMRAARAQDEGRFEKEIVPIELDAVDPGSGIGPAPDGTAGAATAVAVPRTTFAVDEAVRRDTTLEKMAGLQPAFIPDGKITAGNSSQIVDGAAAVLIASEDAVSRLGLEPRARLVSFGLAGVDPTLMLHGNPEACEKALAKAGLRWDDIAVIEVNEAFASVVLQFLADTDLRERWEAGDVNPNGGGISLGHPLGATGARITATLLSELERRDARYGIACMCIGFGQAIAGVVERL
jgi:acetyl-CoA acyltransferase